MRAAALATTFAGRRMILRLAAARTALFAAVRHFVNGRPGAALGFFRTLAAFFVAAFDVLGLSFLFACIT